MNNIMEKSHMHNLEIAYMMRGIQNLNEQIC